MSQLQLDIDVLFYENDEVIYFESVLNEKEKNDIEWLVGFVILLG